MILLFFRVAMKPVYVVWLDIGVDTLLPGTQKDKRGNTFFALSRTQFSKWGTDGGRKHYSDATSRFS
jgi:hypothetical protein